MTALAIIAALTAVAAVLTARRLKSERDAARIESAQRLLRNELQAHAFAEKSRALTRIAAAELRENGLLAERLQEVQDRELPHLNEPRTQTCPDVNPPLYVVAGGAS